MPNTHPGGEHVHKYDPQHAERLLSPERRKMLPPEPILSAIGVAAGTTFADVGAGPGLFALIAAEMVGPSGLVYALDVQPEMLEFVRARAETAGLTNVKALLSQEGRLPLADGSVDAALLSNVLHEVATQQELLREILRALRPGGALGVVEWQKVETPMGPPLSMRMEPAEVESALNSSGFADVTRFATGQYHYGLLARKH